MAKLVDFGLAGDEKGGGLRALEYATIEDGTSSPPNDPRSDLFFLGVIYYGLLTGTPPYPSTSSREERSRISRYSNIRPIRQREPKIPRGIEDIVERLLKLDPDQRYQSPGEVAADLREVLISLGETPPEDPTMPAAPAMLMKSPVIQGMAQDPQRRLAWYMPTNSGL